MALDETGTTATISLSGLDIYAAALINGGVYWATTQAGTSGTVIHWASDSTWSGSYFNTLSSIFSAWSDVADITFQPVGSTNDAEIVLTRTSHALGGYGGYSGIPFQATGDFTDPFVGETVAHLGQVKVFIHNNGDLANASNPTFDTSGNITAAGFEAIMHEIGHALGLKHPDDNGGADTEIYFPGVRAPTVDSTGKPVASGDAGDFGFNNTLYTIMANQYPIVGGALQTASSPMAFDIAAIQTLYGANMTAHAGNDTYALPEPGSATSWTSIWDTGGTDEITYGGTAHAVIDLRAATLDDTADGGGHFSYTYNINPDGSRTYGLGGTIAGDVLGVLPDQGTEHGVVIENASGGSNDDDITGNGADNVLRGNGGNDILRGLDGNDTYILNDVNPGLIHGFPVGLDRYDTVQEDPDGGHDTVKVGAALLPNLLGGPASYTTGYALPDNVEDGVVTGTRNFDLGGNELDNDLKGNDAANTLIGGAGKDTLDGGGGFDTLIGGADNDTYILDDVNPSLINGFPVGLDSYDDVQEDPGGGHDTVMVGAALYPNLLGGPASYTTGYLLRDNVEDGVVTGARDFDLIGNDLANNLKGNDAANTLIGGAGADILEGFGGTDTLTGGLDRDTFVFGRSGGNDTVTNLWGNDTVTDFEVGTTPGTGDLLDLSGVPGLTSLAELTLTDTPDGEKIEFNGNSILLEGISIGQLTAANYVFARKVGDGYISGATVFADANHDGQFDSGEAFGTTDQNGTFSLTNELGTLFAFGGIDTATGLALKAQLSAPEFSIEITPLTTLLTAGADQGKMLAALGLPAHYDVTIMDPIAALQAGNADAASVFVAGAKVMDTVVAFGAAIASLGGNEAIAQHDAFATIAAAVNGLGAGATLDLNNAATVAGLFTTLAQHEGVNGAPVADALGAAIAASNATLDQNLGADGASDALITDTGAVQAVIQANHPPHAVNDVATTTTGIGGTASADAAHGVLFNDSDPDGDTLTVTGFTGGTHGILVLNANGSYSYTVTDLTGPTGTHLHDVFTYGITDGHAGVAVATLDITLNRAPDAVNDSTAVVKGGTITGNVLANDVDPDGDAVALTGVVGGSFGHAIAGQYGSFTLNANGSYTYLASKGGLPSQIVPQDTFKYTVSDGHGGTDVATVSVVVLDPSQSYQAGTNTTLNGGNGPDVLDGSSGHHVLLGGNGADVLIGGVGDTLTGGNGPDTFLFRPDFGADTITDFDIHNDVVQIDKSLFQNVADMLAHYASDSAAGAVIHDAAGDTITFTGVTVADLRGHASDFHLV